MKGKLFIAGIALLAVAACNKPSELKPVNPTDGDQYMAVNLKMSGSASTKAWDAEAFENATDEEIAVAKAQFLFFNGDTQCADIYIPEEEIKWGDPDHQDSDQKKADAIIVLENPTAIPTSIVAILNTDVNLAGKKLSELTSLTDFQAIKGTFVMSNSVYVDGGEVVIGTPVTEENICKSKDLALQAPVEIHVERVLAKVELDAQNASQDADSKAVDSEGNEIVVKIDGFWLDNTNPKANLIKSLAADALEGDWWYDAANFRSYWAKSAKGDLERAAWKDATMDAKYVNENTPAIADVLSDADDSENHAATQIVFATHLEIGGAPADVVKYLSTYYTLDNWKIYVANTLGKYYTKTDGDNTTTEAILNKITAADLTFDIATGEVENPSYSAPASYGNNENIEAWEAVITVSCDKDLYLADGTAATFEAKKYKVQYFKDGKSYFYAPIRHNDIDALDADKKPADGYYGIVRNHLYRVKATKIYGLGTPVPDPGQIIIPIKPIETESYIAAEIDVLKYKVVENEYELK
jgi:hypothetical protein